MQRLSGSHMVRTNSETMRQGRQFQDARLKISKPLNGWIVKAGELLLSLFWGPSPALPVRVSRDPNLAALVTYFTLSTGRGI